MIIENSSETSFEDNFGWRTRITLYPKDISSTSGSFMFVSRVMQ